METRGNPVSIDSIVEEGVKAGLNGENIRKGINHQLRKGKVFEPITGFILKAE